MSAAIESSFTFADLNGLSSLKAAGDTPEARRAVARQFESLFLNLMIRQMRQAGSAIDGGLIDRDKLELQQGMLDQQLALSLSRGSGIGIADSILRSFGDAATAPVPGGSDSARGFPRLEGTTSAALLPVARPAGTPATREARADDSPESAAEGFSNATPADFVRSLWPHAERAARELGVAPDALVAQAALETGWGRSLPHNQYGESSFNLFGIKAGPKWPGPRAVVTTLEFVGGVPEQRREPFRMYSNVGDAFDDYVELVRSKPRYAEALAASTPEEYFRGLERGGYATDPDYAEKLTGILARGLPGRPPAASVTDTVDQVVAANADTLTGGGRL
jgi:flagellar protein FlgJ